MLGQLCTASLVLRSPPKWVSVYRWHWGMRLRVAMAPPSLWIPGMPLSDGSGRKKDGYLWETGCLSRGKDWQSKNPCAFYHRIGETLQKSSHAYQLDFWVFGFLLQRSPSVHLQRNGWKNCLFTFRLYLPTPVFWIGGKSFPFRISLISTMQSLRLTESVDFLLLFFYKRTHKIKYVGGQEWECKNPCMGICKICKIIDEGIAFSNSGCICMCLFL